MHQAVVEVCMMKEINHPLTNACEILAHEPETISLLNTVEIKAAGDSAAPTLHFPDPSLKARFLESFSTMEDNKAEDGEAYSESAAETENTSMAPEIPQPTTTGYLNVALDSPEFKFAVSYFDQFRLYSAQLNTNPPRILASQAN